MNETFEEMKTFFNTRVDIYDKQQIKNIDGGEECYREIAKHIPSGTKTLLDLGCGTGLELKSIFGKFPEMRVTGIDLADRMLERLAVKYSKYPINLINDDYFNVDLGKRKYDAVISVMSFHHFTHLQKIDLYKKIFDCLTDDGVFIECDYMVGSNDSNIEKQFLTEREKVRRDNNLKEGPYHFDIPFTINHETSILKEVGFKLVEKVWGIENNIMLTSNK
jgi:tRNA (cmo5U34)-methyltransferase